MAVWKNMVPNRKVLRELKREALLREAVAAFNQDGFHATSLDDIANSLGVTKAALYRYFPSKHALLFEAFNEALKVAFESLDRAQRSGGNALERLQLAIQGYLEVALSELSRCVILTEEHALLPEHRKIIFEQRDKYEGALRDLVKEGIEEGSIVPCDSKLAIFAIFGAVNWVPKWYRVGGAWSSEQLAKGLSQLVCRSISATPIPRLPTDIALLNLPETEAPVRAATARSAVKPKKSGN